MGHAEIADMRTNMEQTNKAKIIIDIPKEREAEQDQIIHEIAVKLLERCTCTESLQKALNEQEEFTGREKPICEAEAILEQQLYEVLTGPVIELKKQVFKALGLDKFLDKHPKNPKYTHMYKAIDDDIILTQDNYKQYFKAKYHMNLDENLDYNAAKKMDDVLKKLPGGYFSDPMDVKVETLSEFKLGRWDEDTKTMNLTPDIFKQELIISPETKVNLGQKVLLHELGHKIDHEYEYSKNDKWRELSGWSREEGINQIQSRYNQNGLWKKGKWYHDNTAAFINDYAIRNPKEDFSESFCYHLIGLDDWFKVRACEQKMEFIKQFVTPEDMILPDIKEHTDPGDVETAKSIETEPIATPEQEVKHYVFMDKAIGEERPGHKYIKRKGTPGDYKYTYEDETGKQLPANTIGDIGKIIEHGTSKHGSRNEYLGSDEYKQLYPHVEQVYNKVKDELKVKASKAMTEAGIKAGDRVQTVAGGFAGGIVVKGTVIMKAGVPHVKLDHPQMTDRGYKKQVMWHKGWHKAEQTIEPSIQPEKIKFKDFLKLSVPEIQSIDDNIIKTKDGNRIEYIVDPVGENVEINFIDIDKKGTGIGTKLVKATQDYADLKMKNLTVNKPYNEPFWKKMGLTIEHGRAINRHIDMQNRKRIIDKLKGTQTPESSQKLEIWEETGIKVDGISELTENEDIKESIEIATQEMDTKDINQKMGLKILATNLSAMGKNVMGRYFHKYTMIELSPKHTESYMHEYGHFIDDYIGRKNKAGGYASVTLDMFKEVPELKTYQEATRKTKMMERIYQRLKKDNANQKETNKYMRYFEDPSEVFARTFEQYISYKSEQKEKKNKTPGSITTQYWAINKLTSKYSDLCKRPDYFTDDEFKQIKPKFEAYIDKYMGRKLMKSFLQYIAESIITSDKVKPGHYILLEKAIGETSQTVVNKPPAQPKSPSETMPSTGTSESPLKGKEIPGHKYLRREGPPGGPYKYIYENPEGKEVAMTQEEPKQLPQPKVEWSYQDMLQHMKSHPDKTYEDLLQANKGQKWFFDKNNRGYSIESIAQRHGIELKKEYRELPTKVRGKRVTKPQIPEKPVEPEKPSEPAKPLPPKSPYLYHSSSPEKLEKIKEEGLRAEYGRRGGSAYFVPEIDMPQEYPSGKGVMLRIKRESMPYDYNDLGEYAWTQQTVPAKDLEVSNDNGQTWKPIKKAEADIKSAPEPEATPEPEAQPEAPEQQPPMAVEPPTQDFETQEPQPSEIRTEQNPTGIPPEHQEKKGKEQGKKRPVYLAKWVDEKTGDTLYLYPWSSPRGFNWKGYDDIIDDIQSEGGIRPYGKQALRLGGGEKKSMMWEEIITQIPLNLISKTHGVYLDEFAQDHNIDENEIGEKIQEAQNQREQIMDRLIYDYKYRIDMLGKKAYVHPDEIKEYEQRMSEEEEEWKKEHPEEAAELEQWKQKQETTPQTIEDDDEPFGPPAPKKSMATQQEVDSDIMDQEPIEEEPPEEIEKAIQEITMTINEHKELIKKYHELNKAILELATYEGTRQ